MSLCCKKGLEILLNLFSCRRTIHPFSSMSFITEMFHLNRKDATASDCKLALNWNVH